MQDVSLDDRTLASLGCDAAQLAANGWAPATWIELAALLEYEDEGLARDAMPALQKLHLALARRAAAHLAQKMARRRSLAAHHRAARR